MEKRQAPDGEMIDAAPANAVELISKKEKMMKTMKIEQQYGTTAIERRETKERKMSFFV